MKKSQLFINSDLSNYKSLLRYLDSGLSAVKAHSGTGPTYPVSQRSTINELLVQGAFPERGVELDTLLENVYREFEGCVKTGHPLCMKNILPQSNIAGLVGLLLGNIYMANGVTGEDAGALLDCELKCAAAMADLVGYDTQRSSGVFTYGGSGTNLYAIKVGLTKANRDSVAKGNVSNTFVIGGVASHYCHLSAVNWLGIGEDNYVQVPVNKDQSTDLSKLKSETERIVSEGGRIAAIMLSGGTTSNMAIDDVYEIYTFRNMLVEKYKLDYTPHIHCDSVIGWAYCCFKDYDTGENQLKFSRDTLKQIKCLQEKTSKFKYADSLGIDFHKTGFVQYVSSMVIFKNKDDLNLLKKKKERLTPLFHDDACYNPGIFTLETTRATANMLSAWLSINAIGADGYRRLLGNALECANYLRRLIRKDDNGLFIVNTTHYGSDVFIGVKGFGESDPDVNGDVKALNSATGGFAKFIMNGEAEYAVSKSSAAIYNDRGEAIQGIRVYLLTPAVSKKTVKSFYEMLKRDRQSYEARGR